MDTDSAAADAFFTIASVLQAAKPRDYLRLDPWLIRGDEDLNTLRDVWATCLSVTNAALRFFCR